MNISVIMSVYNTKEEYLREAIESIINQTYSDFEFILINDHSDEITSAILRGYAEKDSRIRLVQNEKNLGLTRSLNKGLELATGKYIARMDADDVSYADRLEEQFNYMERNPLVDIVGAWVEAEGTIDHCGGRINSRDRLVRMVFGNYGIVHSIAFVRKEFLNQHNIRYDENYKKAQDYKLWIDCLLNGAHMSVCPKVLLYYRVHENQISNASRGEQNGCRAAITRELICRVAPGMGEEQIAAISDLNNYSKCAEALKQLEDENERTGILPRKALHYECIYQLNCMKKGVGHKGFGYVLYRLKRAIAKNL